MKVHTLRVPTPFPIGPVNLYLIADDPITLVDTGPKTADAFRSLQDQVAVLGLRLEQIRRIIISHTHEDHVGLAARLKEISGAAVYVHPWEVPRLTGPRQYSLGRAMMGRIGVPPDVLDALESHWKGIRRLSDTVSDVQVLDEGDEVPFATESLRVLHTPGHTPGHLCLWREGKRALIAADTILKRITPNPVINLDPRDPTRRFPSLSMYLKTVARLRDLSPTWVHTGHGEPVYDLGEYYNGMLQHVRKRQAKLFSLLPPNATTVWEMSLKMFPGAGHEHRFLAISEVSAHMDFATEEGKLAREESDGVEYYRVAGVHSSSSSSS